LDSPHAFNKSDSSVFETLSFLERVIKPKVIEVLVIRVEMKAPSGQIVCLLVYKISEELQLKKVKLLLDIHHSVMLGKSANKRLIPFFCQALHFLPVI
jgi:hypothetical protein